MRATTQAVAHGTFNGAMSGIQGGKFWNGFAAGAISSAAASLFSGGTNHTGLDEKGKQLGSYGGYSGVGHAVGMDNAAGMIAFGTIAGGAGASLSGGNFWQGAVTGLVVSGLNHAMHSGDGEDGIDPPSKKKALANKIKNNPEKALEVSEAALALKQVRMIDQRKSLSVADKLSTFKKFSTKYARIGKLGGALGNVADVYSTYSDYQDPSLSSARFNYRLGGTAASIGTSSVVGAYAGGPAGAIGGFVVGLGTTAGEIIYDGWNNTILPTISNFTYNFNGYLHR